MRHSAKFRICCRVDHALEQNHTENYLSGVFRSILLVCVLAAAGCASSQTSCGNQKLICLIPTVFHTTASTFNFFNTALGTQITQLPLPSRASGFLFRLGSAGVIEPIQASFGPILSERADTIPRRTAYFSATYQRFAFSTIDGNSLKKLPIVFYFPTVDQPQVITVPVTRVAVQEDQYVGLGTYGLTDKLNISAAVPFGRVSMGVSAAGAEYSTTTSATATFSEYIPGAAAGVEDVVLQLKDQVMKREKYNVAVGGDFRFPTGEAEDYLGTGAYGLNPFVVASARSRVSPHAHLAYQWNSHSVLNTNADGHQQLLPGFFTYNLGVDVGATKRLTIVGDLLGREFFNAPQVSVPRTITVQVAGVPKTFTTIVKVNGSYNSNDLAVGVKMNPWNNLLITVNATVKLDDSGLRAKIVPLAGVSYSF
ncbi:MAG TPA: hypothetical protein VGL22_13395 [Terracidiphilus sp.]|jgi:hypothetical protein